MGANHKIRNLSVRTATIFTVAVLNVVRLASSTSRQKNIHAENNYFFHQLVQLVNSPHHLQDKKSEASEANELTKKEFFCQKLMSKMISISDSIPIQT
jgi:hypothetical protein